MNWAGIGAKLGKLGKGVSGLATGSTAFKVYAVIAASALLYGAGLATVAWHNAKIEEVRSTAYKAGADAKQQEWESANKTAKEAQASSDETATSKFKGKQVKQERVYIKQVEEVIKYEPDPSRGCSYDPDFVRRFNALQAEPPGGTPEAQNQ